jgi:hypothetical protein
MCEAIVGSVAIMWHLKVEIGSKALPDGWSDSYSKVGKITPVIAGYNHSVVQSSEERHLFEVHCSSVSRGNIRVRIVALSEHEVAVGYGVEAWINWISRIAFSNERKVRITGIVECCLDICARGVVILCPNIDVK